MPWDVDIKTFAKAPYTGREQQPGPRSPRYPTEDPEGGCPAGWRRSAYVQSVAPYFRMRAAGGVRVSNPLLDRCDDPAILAAVLMFEQQQERCIAHTEEVEATERARRAEQAQQERASSPRARR